MPDPLIAVVDGNLRVAVHTGQDDRRTADVEIHVDDVAPVDEHADKLARNRGVFVYTSRGTDVEMNIVGGEIIVEEGRSTRVDQDAVVAEALGRARDLADRIKLR